MVQAQSTAIRLLSFVPFVVLWFGTSAVVYRRARARFASTGRAGGAAVALAVLAGCCWPLGLAWLVRSFWNDVERAPTGRS